MKRERNEKNMRRRIENDDPIQTAEFNYFVIFALQILVRCHFSDDISIPKTEHNFA